MRGVALGLYPDGRGARQRHATELAEIADLGATHVALVVTWAQRDVRATELAPSDATVPDRVLTRAIADAHRAGLEVLVFPIVTVEKTREGEWRGTLRPRDVDAWWQAYERFVLHYARLAADGGAAALLVGSELGTTELWKDRWYHLLSRVEQVYEGDLVYSANWDHYRMVSFWRRLDAFGVTGYFELTGDADASEAELVRAWNRAADELEELASERGIELWITEVGYTSTDGAAVRPWDYTSDEPLDLEEQRRAYAAFARAWRGRDLGGVFFWNWWGEGGAGDRGYTPKGKPAEKILRRFFGARSRTR